MSILPRPDRTPGLLLPEGRGSDRVICDSDCSNLVPVRVRFMYRDTGVLKIPPSSAEEDAVLLARVQRGEEPAMASLFDRYSKLVYSVALRVLRDPAAAEDVLQEIFLQVWRSPEGFRATRGSLGGWLAVVARNR